MLADEIGIGLTVDEGDEILRCDGGEEQVAGESPFAFGDGVERAIEGDFLEEWLIGSGKLWPEFVGAVDDRAGTERREGTAANGKSPWFEIVAASMRAKDSA